MVRGLLPASGMTTETMPLAGAPAERPERRAKPAAAGAPQLAGTLWFAGWLFTIGFAELVWWKALLAVVLWPYFLGTAVR